jgi:putative membrane protein
MRVPFVALLSVALAAAAACRDGAADHARGDTGLVARPDSGGAGSLSDPQVITLVAAIHNAEVGAAGAAMPKLGRADVRAFAQRMVQEHAAMDSLFKALPAHGQPMPVPPPQVPTMQAAAKAQGDLLDAMAAGPAFDRVYVASQVADHQMALDSLQRWRQVTRDEALRRQLDAALQKVGAHLEAARALQRAVGSGGTPAEMTPPPASTLGPTKVERPAGRIGSQRPDTAVSNVPVAGSRPRPDSVRQR